MHREKWAISECLLLVFVSIFAILNVVKFMFALNNSWDTTIPEDAVVYSILSVAGSDHPLYRDFSQFPYTTTPYGPVYYWLSGLLCKCLGGSVAKAYFSGRVISLISFGIDLKIIASLALRAGASARSALIASLLVCGMPLFYPWAVSCRPDSLAVAFSISAILLLRPEASGNQPKSLACWLTAFFVKPSFVAGPVAWTVYLLVRKDWKGAFQWAGWFGLATAIGLSLAQYLSGGEYYANAITANLTRPSWEGSMGVLAKLAPIEIFVLGAGVIRALMNCVSVPKWNFMHLISLCALVSTICFGAGTLKAGAAENYFFEPLFLCIALLAPLLDYSRSCANYLKRMELIIVISMCCALVWSPVRGIIDDFLWTIRQPGRREFEKLIQNTPGEMLFLSNGQGMRLGRGVTIHDGYNASYLEKEGKISLESFARRIENREFSAILELNYESYYDYTLMPPSFLGPIIRNYKIAAVNMPYRLLLLRPRTH